MRKPRDIRTVVGPPGSELAVTQSFVLANARSFETAKSLAALGLEFTPAVESLKARGLLTRAPAGGWYLDSPGYAARQLRRRMLEIGVIGGVVALFGWLLVRVLS